MQTVHLKDLLEAGCHFGHQVNRWHPKAKTFIYQSRGGIHIIDLVKTKQGVEKACEFIKSVAREGGIVLFVATKRQAKNIVKEEAKRVGVAYLTHRWVGGFFTNWDEVKKNITKVNSMRVDKEKGVWEQFPKHEQVKLGKELRKLEEFYGGVSHLTELPNAVFIVDIKREKSALAEATKREVPVVAMVDTNGDPTTVDYAIPANDDAVGSITCIATYIANAYLEGKAIGEKEAQEKKAKEAKEPQAAKTVEQTVELKKEESIKEEEKKIKSEAKKIDEKKRKKTDKTKEAKKKKTK